MQELKTFFAGFDELEFPAGEVLLDPDEHPRGVFYLSSGLVKLYTYSENGATTAFHLFEPGACFPVEWILSGKTNGYYYECLTPVKARLAPAEKVRDFFKTHPASLFALTERLWRGIAGLLDRLEANMTRPVYGQVAGLLLYFSRHLGEKDMPLTHQAIADWTGCTRETVSVQMEKMRRRGLIAYKGSQVSILDKTKLEAGALG